jgi:isopentenyl-diphosphate delta-isomerase
MHEDELLDLVNKNDEIVGTIWRSESHKLSEEDLGYIRAVDLFIQNDKGELWVPKRTAYKKIAPNGLDYSAGGHVSSGETYDEAMVKEVSEELNLQLSHDELEVLGVMGPGDNRYIRKIYRYHTNETPQYNPDDFVSAEWMTIESLKGILKSGVPAKESILPTLEYFSDKLTIQ